MSVIEDAGLKSWGILMTGCGFFLWLTEHNALTKTFSFFIRMSVPKALLICLFVFLYKNPKQWVVC